MLRRHLLSSLLLAPTLLPAQWPGHNGDPQHSGLSPVPAARLSEIRWSTTVDENALTEPIFIHFSAPLATRGNTIIVTVRAPGGAYCIDAHRGEDGTLLWEQMTDFANPPSNGGWVPAVTPALAPSGALYYAGAGGTVYRVDQPDVAPVSPVQIAPLPGYGTEKAAYDASVFVSTPLTSDAAGNIYYGYEVSGSAPGGLTSGIARVTANGATSYASANSISGIANATGYRVATNCGPALSIDGTKVYVALTGNTPVLVAFDAATLSPVHHVTLAGVINDASTASPTVGPDGDVYYGTLYGYHFRGNLEHFSGDLSVRHPMGSFGWDETVSIVPRATIPTYSGSSSYLLFSKYNDYKQVGGTGVNKLAILDPRATQTDPVTGQQVMKEVQTIAGVTPDPVLPYVREWCINNAVVDPATRSVLANSEDGRLYRWNLESNRFTEAITLQVVGVLEAYTPTAVGPDGTVYAINKGTLFAVAPEPSVVGLLAVGVALLTQRRHRK